MSTTTSLLHLHPPPSTSSGSVVGRRRRGAAATRKTRTTRTTKAAADDATSSTAKMRIFKGGSKEMLFGAKQNMLGCLERSDEAGIEAAIDELGGMNPTEAPAESPLLGGKWRLVWSKQAESANPFQKAFGKAAKKNYQIINVDGSLENLVELGPLTVSGRAAGGGGGV